MASSPVLFTLLIQCFFLLSLLLSSNSLTVHARKFNKFHIVQNYSLSAPSPACSPPEDPGRDWLMVNHRYGPCSPITGTVRPTAQQIFHRDQRRVGRLQARAKAGLNTSLLQDSDVSLPAHSGISLDSGNYVVTIGLGSPTQDQTVIFDTGSDVCWVQCQPCTRCFQQQGPIYDPSQSSTYQSISCADCGQLESGTCSGSTCAYRVGYGDGSTTQGVYSYESLTLSQTGDAISNFAFGCGNTNQGIFGQVAGLFGLGRGKASLVSQTSQKYGGVFSYCLPRSSSSSGFLAFGQPGDSSAISYTSFATDRPIFYYVSLVAISVGGEQLPVDPTVLSSGGTIVDSGTVITRLPSSAYSQLRSAFKGFMTNYNEVGARDSLLDTCYDFGGAEPQVPEIELQFDGGASLKLDESGILYDDCLAFAATDDGDTGIIGNVQQKGFEVVYDVGNSKIGFRPNAC